MFKEKTLSRSVRVIFSGGVAVSLGLLANPVFAQEDVQRVEITGSAIKRIAQEGALPVTVMKREDIERTGATTAADLVNLIPSNFGGSSVTQNVGATGVAATAGLRALPAKYTLVLVNGRRLSNYAFGNQPVDLNSIPLGAVERVEVLRDGASAIYGADAVAGVINFILKKNYQGLEASVYGTDVRDGGGNDKSYSITGGYGNMGEQGFNVMLSAQHEDQDALKAKDRSFANTAVRPDLGINKASPRNGVPNLNFTDSLGNSYTGVNPYRYNGCVNPEFALVQIGSPKNCGTDYVKFIDLIPLQKHDNVVGRATLKINEDHELYAEAMYTKDKLTASYSPAPYTKPMVYPAGGRFYPTTITIPKGYVVPAGTTYKLADGTTLPAGSVLAADTPVTPVGNLSGTWRTVAGGGRTDITEQSNSRFIVGAKGNVMGWDYDTAFTYSKNEGTVYYGPGKFSYTKLTPLLASGQINVFGSQDATSLAALNSALLTGPENTATSINKEVDFKVSKEIAQLTYGAVGLAFGASYRKEELNQFSYPVQASGDEVGGAGPVLGVVGDRKVYGVFTEASIPLYKDLEAQVAARYDDYKNGFGTEFSKLSPKLSLNYKPSNAVLLRGSYAQGFRAPSLYDNLYPFVTGNNTNGNFNDPIRCPNGVPIQSKNPVGALQDECAVQLPTATSGNTDLKPEKSKQFSLGIVFQPTASFSGSVDYFDIKIDDAINQMSEQTPFGNPTAYANNFYRYDPAQFPNGWVDDGKQTGAIKGSTNPDFPLAYVLLPKFNTGRFFAAGWDVNLNYKTKAENIGNFSLNFDGTLFTKHGYQYAGSDEVSDLGNYKDFGPAPRFRGALTGAFARGPWNASVTYNYTGGYKDYTDPSLVGTTNYPADRDVSAYETIDATLGFRGIKNLEIVGGVKNLMDRDPPSSRTTVNFQTGYDAQFTNPLGRTFYIRAKYKFW
jgi:iron complex outermembrane receptor protein